METWKNIVAEMRSISRRFRIELEDDTIGRFADRIEAACKTLEDVLIIEQEENAKLRRALEPVMNACEEDAKCDAVREAQAIMKEGAE